MGLSELRISADAYYVCLTHVLSTESTEVMGVLLGDLDAGNVGRVCSAKVMVRLDKRKDRVEISPEQLLSAAREAEQLAAELGRTVRVIGWYHSHPHITVWPSVVDIGTQDSFQTMDSCFAGVIFAVFPDRKGACVQTACFQSARGEAGQLKRRDVPLRIEPTRTVSAHCWRALIGLAEVMREEEVTGFDAVRGASAGDELTALHNQAVLVRNTTQTLGLLTLPLVRLLENRLEHNQRALRRLLAERDALAARLDGAVANRESDMPAGGRRETYGRSKVKREPGETAGARHESNGRSKLKQKAGDRSKIKLEPGLTREVKQEPGLTLEVKQEPGVESEMKQESIGRSEVKQESGLRPRGGGEPGPAAVGARRRTAAAETGEASSGSDTSTDAAFGDLAPKAVGGRRRPARPARRQLEPPPSASKEAAGPAGKRRRRAQTAAAGRERLTAERP